MRLRYNLNGNKEIAEIDRMYYENNRGCFVRADGKTLYLPGIDETVWRRLIANMFVDGKLSIEAEINGELHYE